MDYDAPHILRADEGYVIGLDLGGTKLLAGLFDPGGRLVTSQYVRIGGQDADGLLDSMASAVLTLAPQADGPVAGVGLGCPATIDRRTGTAVHSSHLPIHDRQIGAELSALVGLPVAVDNDANVAALAEQRRGVGAARGVRHLIMITLGTGLGGGIIIDGRLASGAIGAGAEMGHMSIDFDGLPCISSACRGIGCLETYCSGTALARDLRAFIEANPTSRLARDVESGAEADGELVVAAARDGDSDALALFEAFGYHLGVGLAGFVNLFNPEIIAIGGGMVPALEWIMPVATRVVRERALPPGNTYVEIVRAHFAGQAGIVGAAELARDTVVRTVMSGSVPEGPVVT